MKAGGKCVKCDSDDVNQTQGIAKAFTPHILVACQSCGYTELYEASPGSGTLSGTYKKALPQIIIYLGLIFAVFYMIGIY